jgi:hypothetical protein
VELMAGFEPPSSGQKLDFSDTAYAGLEVTMDAISLGDLLDIEDLAEGVAAGAAARELCARFAKCLESWNVTRKGEPVPPTMEGLLTQDAAFVLALVRSWQQGMAVAPPPLPGGSPSGGSSAEASTLGLDAASRSLPS